MEVRKGYKKTEVGVIPEDWDCIQLGNIGDCIIGLTYKPSDVKDYGRLVLRSSNINENRLVFTDNVYVDIPIKDDLVVQENDILICVRNGSRNLIGKCALIDKKSTGQTFGAFMSVFRSIYGRYLFNCFQSSIIKKQLNEIMGATINQITNKDLKSFYVPLPNNDEEQQAIAEALSDVDAVVSSLTKLISKKKKIKQGVMQELLTGEKRLEGFNGEWKIMHVSNIGKTYGGLAGKTKADFGHGNSKYIPFMNVMSNPVIDMGFLENVKIADGEFQNNVKMGDLFFNTSSETPEEVGMCSVLLEDVDNLYLNSFCFGFRVNDLSSFYPLYLSYFFRSDVGRKLMFSLAQGATRYNLSKNYFNKLRVALPGIEEQIAIANIISDMDAEIEALEQKLSKYKAIKQGMMQELLTGKIRLI